MTENRYSGSMRPKHPKDLLSAAKTRAFLVTDLTNVQYLTGLSVTSGCVLVTGSHFLFFTDSRYLEMAEHRAYRGIKVHDREELQKTLQSVRSCGCESESLSLEVMRRMKRKYKSTKFIHTTGIIEEFRRSKSDDELRAFRRAQRITREMIRRVPTMLRRAISEKELAWQLEVWAHELGADDLSFPSIVAFGTNTSVPHHSPTTRRLKKGHIVQIDCGAKYGGYCADQSAVFFTGKPTAFQKHVYEVLLEAKDEVVMAVKKGVTTHELDHIARDILEREGIEHYFTHSLGHGVGLNIHEGVTLSQKAPKQTLLKNEIVTVEPGVYFPGKFGMRVEEEVIVR